MNSTKYAGESMKASTMARGSKPPMEGRLKGKTYTAGAMSGEGRMQKIKAYGNAAKRK